MPKIVSIKSIDNQGNETEYISIAEAAYEEGCDESTIRKVINKSSRTAKGKKWITAVQEEEAENTPLREIDTELDKLGIDIKDVRQVWAKQMKNGSYRYSISVSEQDKFDEELLLKKIEQSIKLHTTPAEYDVKAESNSSILVYTADKHIGAKTKNNSLYENEYNEEVFEDRMFRLLERLIDLSDTFGTFKDLYFLDLGDPLDGYNKQTTRGGHSLPQNMTNEEAFDTYFRVHKKFFDSLVEYEVAENIHFKAVTNDNHSGSFGYTAQRALEIYLNTAYNKITTTLSNKFITHFKVGNHTFIVTHGKDSEDRAKGLPLVLDEKTKNFVSDYIDYHNLNSPQGYVHLIKGDLHQSSSQLTGKFRYRNTLSLYGSSAWIQNNFGNQTVAGVSIDIVDREKNEVFETNLIY